MGKRKSFLNNGEGILFVDCIEDRLYKTYSLLAKNRFKWNNLPNKIESHKVEEFLYNCGQVAFFEDSKFGLMCLPCFPNGQLDPYGEPLTFTVYGTDYNEILDREDMVWIKANDDCYPMHNHIFYYTNWINKIERTMHRNLDLMQQPDIIATTKENEATMKIMYEQIREGKEAIYYEGDRANRGEVGVRVLNRNAQNYLPYLQTNKNDVIYELLTLLGINNANTGKKERLLVDEVNVNNIHILMNLDFEFKNRVDAVKKINEKFKEKVEVELVIEELKNKFMIDDGGVNIG